MSRIIQVVPAISEEASGPSYSVRRLTEAVAATGYDVDIAAVEWGPMNSPPEALITFPLGLGPRRLACSPAMWKWLAAEAEHRKVDLLHSHSLWAMPNVYPGWVARRYGTPLMVSPRGTLSAWAMQSGSVVKKLFWPLVQKPALDATTCFHATATSEYEDIRRMGFLQPVAVIPNGIDIPATRVTSTAAGRTLLFLGRIHPKKGLNLLLPAWRVLQDRHPDWRLRIVGSDGGFLKPSGYLAQIRSMADALDLKRVEFTGALFGEAKWAALADADLFVLPSYSENFGMSVAEALASGTPAVVTRGAPWHDLENRHAGRWVEIGARPLQDALDQLMRLRPERLLAMGQNGRKWMQQEFSWDSIGQKMAATYEWVLRGGNTPEWIRQD